MANDYLPRADSDFLLWVANFSSNISADPSAYSISEDNAAQLTALTATFQDAYLKSQSGTTRGPMSVVSKNMARADVEAFARQLAMMIQSNPSITDSQKIAIRIKVYKKTKTPIQVAASSPSLHISKIARQGHTLGYCDETTSTRKVKPFGTAFLQLHMWITPIGVTPTGRPDKSFSCSRTPIRIDFTPNDVGKQATYLGYWINVKGAVGPVSNYVSSVIA